jgi:hypothetical protein
MALEETMTTTPTKPTPRAAPKAAPPQRIAIVEGPSPNLNRPPAAKEARRTDVQHRAPAPSKPVPAKVIPAGAARSQNIFTRSGLDWTARFRPIAAKCGAQKGGVSIRSAGPDRMSYGETLGEAWDTLATEMMGDLRESDEAWGAFRFRVVAIAALV